MSPLSNLSNLTDIRSMSNTSSVYNVGSIDGPVHCVIKFRKLEISRDKICKRQSLCRRSRDVKLDVNFQHEWLKRACVINTLTTTMSPTYSYTQYVTHAHCTNPRVTLARNLLSFSMV
ncbi:hypothetical protein X777_11432 [Ooceraea biroi]|uniref:Uncharacterized protein n=1 Tax=Ooceraea biroi TaxID=2015173 RepID=A0A026W4H3_OOCBI|nr:hypothetical protein X777_11432 [Ooceraea biroi]